ncbi:MAG TPA: hypothetical protein VHO91_10800 [Rhodopila sp.]|nr:hypothetical protein [Rhodopila sp.]
MMRQILTALALSALAAPAALAVPISQLPAAPGAAASLSDAVAAQSSNCTGGDCRETIQQIVNTVLQTANTFTVPQTVLNAAPPAFNVDYQLLTGQIGATSGGAIYNSICSGCRNADAVRGVATAPAGSDMTNVNGVASYVLNDISTTAAANSGNGVSFFGVITAGVDGANNWGINTNVEDAGKSGVNLLNEFDFNVGNSGTKINGLIMQGASSAKPYQANGFVIGNLNLSYATTGQGSSIPWSNGFVTEDAAAQTAIQIGLAGARSGANLTSQPIAMASTDASGGISYAFFENTPNGMAFSSSVVPMHDSSASFGSPAQSWYEGWFNRVDLKPNTAGGLPGCSYTYLGMLAFVTDSQSTQIETNLQGGGAYHVVTFCDGAEWVVL